MINRRFALGLAVAPALLLLAACGGSDSKSTAATPAPAATTSRTNAGADVPPTNTVGGGQLGSATPSATTTTSTAVAKLNLNSASGADYKRVIPNFPDRFVTEFLEYKPYVSIAQFRKEMTKYIGAAQVTEWEKYVFVPVKPNDSDAETLKQIPGVTDSVASQLMAARPYANNDAFLTKLTALVPGVDVTQAKTFLG